MPQTLWLVWLIVAIVTLVGELLSLGLFLASLSIAALLTAAVSLAAPVPVQIVFFCLVSLVLLLAVRPAVLHLLPRASASNNAPAIGPVGQRALVEESVSQLNGQIRVGVGQFWTARPEPAGIVIPIGSEVEVVRMEGLTAVVRPVDSGEDFGDLEREESADIPFGLTAREVQVLQLVARGLSNADIAARLYLSQRTVDHHVSHILHKMQAGSRVEATRLALQRGLVPPDDIHPHD